MTTIPLLQTKLNLPQLSKTTVARPRLLQRLQQGATTRVTLIAAPAGFGKTTVAAAYINALNTQAALANDAENLPQIGWITLDSTDNDLTRFLQYLVAAVQRVAPDCGVQMAALLDAPQPVPLIALVTLLLNDLATLTHPLLIVLEDYHLIEEPLIHEALTMLIEQLPASVHILLLSRADPPLPLARWRVQGYLTEIRAADLRFTLSEIEQFFQLFLATPFQPAAVAQLATRTEGWIAALQLAALSLPQQDDMEAFLANFSGGQRHLVDYLVDEVFRLQPADVQEFLLATAVLDRFCAALCCAVVYDDGVDGHQIPSAHLAAVQQQLERLERHNLFLIPLDDERRWYRYHALFAEFLRHRLGHSAQEYHRRAAGWYKATGWIEASIDHLLAAQEMVLAADEIAAHGLPFVLRHQLSTVQRWLRLLPQDMRAQRLELVLCEFWLILGTGNLVAMVEALTRTTEKIETAEKAGAQLTAAIRGELAAAHALVASFRQEHQTTIDYAQRALAQLPAQAAQLRVAVLSGLGYGYYCAGDLTRAESTLRHALQLSQTDYIVVHVTLLGMLAMAIELQGRMGEAVEIYREILALAQARATRPAAGALNYLPTPSVLLALHGLALRLYEFNQLDEADTFLTQALTLSRATGNQMIEGHAQATQALVQQARGNSALAEQLVIKAEAILRPLDVASITLVQAQRVNFWCQQGKIGEAVAWAEHFAATAPARPTPLTAFASSYFALARVWIECERFDEADVLLTDLRAQAVASSYHYYVLWAEILQVRRLVAEGRLDAAEERLLMTLQMAVRAGYVRSFTDEGRPIQALLQHIRTQSSTLDPQLCGYIDQLIASFSPAAAPSIPTTAQTQPTVPSNNSVVTPLIEPLTERELEVLQLVAQGLSNRAMAEELTVALSTVKKHLVHIYAKLDVNSRTQALVRAGDLGLLP